MKRIASAITTVTMLVITCSLQAQVNLQNNGVLYVSGNSDTIYINGAFTNASGAGLTNNGHIQVKQDLINNQLSMAIGTGTLYLNGSSLQTLSGAQAFKTFNLVSDNSAGILLSNDLSVTGAHTFITGIISSSATPNYLIYESGSSYTGDGDNRHVSGWVKKNGSTAFVFPVGNGTVERTIAITNLSATSTFNASYMGATSNTSNIASPLVSADPYEYWMLNRISGGTAQVAMNWNNSKKTFPAYVVTDIRTANYTAGNWTNAGGSASGNITTTGTITSNVTGTFGAFTFGSVSSLLPVQLIDISARRVVDHNVVGWTTADEINVQRYEVQRSDDGSNFYASGNVAALNTNQVHQYGWTDYKPMKEVAYYRLRSIDNDGRSRTSKVVAVYDKTVPGNLFAVTNPAHSAVAFTAGSNHNGLYNYKITAVNGQVLQQGRVNIINGGNYSIPLVSTIVAGVYVFEINGSDFRYSQKILVQ